MKIGRMSLVRPIFWRYTHILTQLALQVTVLIVFDVFVLAEEVLVDVSASKQPHVRVVRDGSMGVVVSVQSSTLSLGLHRRDQERNTEELQQLLELKRNNFRVMNSKL